VSWDSVKSVFGILAGLFAATGFVVVGLIRLGQETYYSALGTSVGEVQVSLPEVLGAGAVTATWLGLSVIFALLLLLAYVPGIYLIARVTGGGLLATVVNRLMPRDDEESDVLRIEMDRLREALRRALLSIIVFLLLVVPFMVAFLGLQDLGVRAARDVVHGRRLSGPANRLLGVSADCVSVSDVDPLSTDAHWTQIDPAMLIGTSADHVLLISGTDRDGFPLLWRIPTSRVVLTSAWKDGRCP
jgi:hypothetical protein